MVMSIFVSSEDDKVRFVSGNSLSMLGVIYPLADVIKNEHPGIFEKAYYGLAYGDVYFDQLDEADMQIVYELSMVQYRSFVRRKAGLSNIEKAGVQKLWDKYICYLSEDKRVDIGRDWAVQIK